jgi:glutamine synthetase
MGHGKQLLNEHDSVYSPPPKVMSDGSGFSDLIAKIDHSTGRRSPLTGTPIYLVDFNDISGAPIPYCPRSLLKRIIASQPSLEPFTGVEFEFYNFIETQESLEKKQGVKLAPMTNGMFGYSVIRPGVYQKYFDDIFNHTHSFGIPLECFHTETG